MTKDIRDYSQFVGKQSNYGKIRSIWPQSNSFVILNTENGSQFCVPPSTIQVFNKAGFTPMIMRSDSTGVSIGFHDEQLSGLEDLTHFRVVCKFEGEKTYAEKQATDFLKAYNEYFSFITNNPSI